jgi:nitroreductase
MPLYVLRGSLALGFRHLRYSGLMGEKNERQSIGRLIASYHTIEKGLTMPDFRPGFGQGAIINLIEKCNAFIDSYNASNVQLIHCVQVILEYKQVHEELGFVLDSGLIEKINMLQQRISFSVACSHQNIVSCEDYFSKSISPFPEFSKSRASIRNFADQLISDQTILEAVRLARSAPSACNRQSVRVHLVRDKIKIDEILRIQAGSRGFSHTVRNLILITTDLSSYFGPNELTIGWVDGGMFAMNLCLSLHHLKVASCPLNCSMSTEKQRAIRNVLPIPKNESFVLLLAAGYPPQEFKYTVSKRYQAEQILSIY